MSYADAQNGALNQALQGGISPALATRQVRTVEGMSIEQRFRCLELALGAPNTDGREIVARAGEFYDFVTGKTVADRVVKALADACIG